jgi:hypothetical protein
MNVRRIVCVAAAVALASTAVARPADAAPVRSGTIIGGWFPFAVVLAPGGEPRCDWNVDCLAWLASDCNRALAGRDPGVFASIVDVADLARSRKTRTLTIDPRGPGIMWGGVGIEFWTRGCRPIRPYPSIPTDFRSVRFKIPRAAAWMTVASVDDTTFRWALR